MAGEQGEGFNPQEQQEVDILAHFVALSYKLSGGETLTPTEEILIGELEQMFTVTQVVPPGGLPT